MFVLIMFVGYENHLTGDFYFCITIIYVEIQYAIDQSPVCKAEMSEKIWFSLFLYDLHRVVTEFHDVLCLFFYTFVFWVGFWNQNQPSVTINKKRGWGHWMRRSKVKVMCVCRSEQMILSKQSIVITQPWALYLYI